MCVVSNFCLVFPIVIVFLCILLLVLNHFCDWWWVDDWQSILIIIVMICCLIWGGISIGMCANALFLEPSLYAEQVSEYNTITAILNNSTDVVNSEIYLKAIEYNDDVQWTKAILNNPKFSIFASGCKCDWASLPLIEIP